MLKNAFDKGTADALNTFGVRKLALARVNPKAIASGVMKPLGGNFLDRQMQHGKNLISSLGNLGEETGRGLAWESAKGLLPSAGIAAGGLYLGSKLLGKSPEEKAREQQARMGMLG